MTHMDMSVIQRFQSDARRGLPVWSLVTPLAGLLVAASGCTMNPTTPITNE